MDSKFFWRMDSGFQYRPGFRIPMLDIPDSKEKISRIPDSGLPYLGRERKRDKKKAYTCSDWSGVLLLVRL